VSKLLSTTDSSEFGVPTTGTPAKYSWLGGEQQPTELPSGVIAMGARSYVPQLGRFLQADPIPGGSANAYAYTFGDPVNSSDPSGALTYGCSRENGARNGRSWF
jgi:RHS repeat-associated protein